MLLGQLTKIKLTIRGKGMSETKEFNELDVDLVDFKDGRWGWGQGGHGLKDDEFTVSFVDDDLNETRYKVPTCICKMLKLQYKYGGDDAKRKIHAALAYNNIN